MVEPEEKTKKTLGFSVSNAPLWLCKELNEEAEEYYAGSYSPVIVDWYRKAKEWENLTRSGLPPPTSPGERRRVELELEEQEDKGVALLGGNFGNKK